MHVEADTLLGVTIVEVVYNDACGYRCIAEGFEAIRSAHTTILVDGKGFRELGRIVRSVEFQQRNVGAREPP